MKTQMTVGNAITMASKITRQIIPIWKEMIKKELEERCGEEFNKELFQDEIVLKYNSKVNDILEEETKEYIRSYVRMFFRRFNSDNEEMSEFTLKDLHQITGCDVEGQDLSKVLTKGEVVELMYKSHIKEDMIEKIFKGVFSGEEEDMIEKIIDTCYLVQNEMI